jgi:Secretion system C-terminal sorting domain/Beta-propeller repeat
VEGYSRLVYKNVYPYIDMQVYSNNVGTKLYFVCNPIPNSAYSTDLTGNPADIEIEFRGATSVNVTGGGGLHVVTELGTLYFAPGYAYTDSDGVVVPLSWQAYFETVSSNVVKLHTVAHNSTKPLIIEVNQGRAIPRTYPPLDSLIWSTYFGGTDLPSQLSDVCSDAHGNIFATGYSNSLTYPTTIGAFQSNLYQHNTQYINATVAKFYSNDKRDWATYYGGIYGTFGHGVCVDDSGDVYITGTVGSTDLPQASDPSSPLNYVQRYLNNCRYCDVSDLDAFIAMFDSTGQYTRWATYYGDTSASEEGNHITIDKLGNLYVVGGGLYAANPTTFHLKKSNGTGAYNDSTYGRGFILEFNASHPSAGITLSWATRIGDTNHATDISNPLESQSMLYGCTVDSLNNFYVTGVACGLGYTSPAVPTFSYVPNIYNFGENAVVTEFNPNNHVLWSSYYGGNGDDVGYAIAVDRYGYIYITGTTNSDSSGGGIGIETNSGSGPSGFFQRHDSLTTGTGDGFLAEFSYIGSTVSLHYGTYFGGPDGLTPQAMKIDQYDNLFITGNTRDLPIPPAEPSGSYYQTSYVNGGAGTDAFIAEFIDFPNATPTYAWGTYFGSDEATGLCISPEFNDDWIYIVGNVGCGYTPLIDKIGSYFDSSYFFGSSGPTGTSFISQFFVNTYQTVGINNIKEPPGGIIVYPNPTSEDITLEIYLDQPENVEISLVDLLGEPLLTKEFKNQQGTIKKQISLSSLPNATYMVRVITTEKTFCKKITKLQ